MRRIAPRFLSTLHQCFSKTGGPKLSLLLIVKYNTRDTITQIIYVIGALG
jgi:hypothetical protein